MTLYCKKFFADSANSLLIALPSSQFALKTTYNKIDQGFLELGGSSGSYNFIETIFKRLAEIETTLIIYRSLLFVVFALAMIITFIFLKETIVLALVLLSLLCLTTFTSTEEE